jgi:large subunit ribosomal protein L32
MPNPKRRHSRQRRDKRRTHWKIKSRSLSICPQCKSAKKPHHVCPTCGYYKGQEVIKTDVV